MDDDKRGKTRNISAQAVSLGDTPSLKNTWKQFICQDCRCVSTSNDGSKICRLCLSPTTTTKETELSFVYFIGDAKSRRDFILENQHFAEYYQPRKAQVFTNDKSLLDLLSKSKSNFNVSSKAMLGEDTFERFDCEKCYYHNAMLVLDGVLMKPEFQVLESLKNCVDNIQLYRQMTLQACFRHDEHRIWILEDEHSSDLTFLKDLFQTIDRKGEVTKRDSPVYTFPQLKWANVVYPDVQLNAALRERAVLVFEGEEAKRRNFIVTHMDLFGNDYSYGQRLSRRTQASHVIFKTESCLSLAIILWKL